MGQEIYSGLLELNQRPVGLQPNALPTELNPDNIFYAEYLYCFLIY